MSFKSFYKNICLVNRQKNTQIACPTKEDSQIDREWFRTEGPKKIGDNKYHVTTTYLFGYKTFPARELTNENRQEILESYKVIALDYMVKNYGINIDKVASSTVIDIYAEPVECYPLKVLVEVITDVD